MSIPMSLHSLFMIFSNFIIFFSFSLCCAIMDMGDLVCVDCYAFESIRFCCECMLKKLLIDC